MARKFTLAICQNPVTPDKEANVARAVSAIGRAKEAGAQVAVLPEMFNCPYQNDQFGLYAEAEDGKTVRALSEAARKNGITLFGGSIPEREGENLFNTCFIFDPFGRVIGKHRKVHLFDIDVPGGIRFMESEVLSAGSQITVVDTEFGKIGAAICYDMRFPELFRLMALKGANLVIVPAAFNMTTGPAHWETLLRARALDNQLFVAACAPARNEHASYVSYANSLAVDPYGQIMIRAGAEETMLLAEIDPGYAAAVRERIPVMRQRRTDLYTLTETGNQSK